MQKNSPHWTNEGFFLQLSTFDVYSPFKADSTDATNCRLIATIFLQRSPVGMYTRRMIIAEWMRGSWPHGQKKQMRKRQIIFMENSIVEILKKYKKYFIENLDCFTMLAQSDGKNMKS